MTPGAELQGFAFGEDVETETGRSIGCHLLAPKTDQPWAKEVEQLARHLQAAPYPEHWQPADLFCSVLLSDGRRLIAAARYGQTDHTPGKRGGVVELLGVIGPANLHASSALRIYRWLCQQRSKSKDLRGWGGPYALDQVLSSTPEKTESETVSSLPMTWSNDDVLLFWASSPSDPDRRAQMLTQDSSNDWQWLPLCDSDFPFADYRRRGRLIAWLPPHVDVAQKWSPPSQTAPAAAKLNWPVIWTVSGLFLVLLVANLWALLSLHGRLADSPQTPRANEYSKPPPPKVVVKNESKEDFAKALYRVLSEGNASWIKADSTARTRYREMAAANRDLGVESAEGQALVGLTAMLAKYDPDRVAQLIEDEFKGKQGLDASVVELISRRVKQRLQADMTAAK